MLHLLFLIPSLFRMATLARALDTADPPPGDGERKPKATEILQRYNGDAVRMAEELAGVLGDNYKLREQRRDLNGEIATLKPKVAPEGATVLVGDEAAAWAAYRELGAPAEVKGRLDQFGNVQGELTGLKRDATLREVAEVAGYKPAVLARLGADLEYVVRDATEDGKPVKRAFVVTDKGERPLVEYAEQQWGDFLPALTATAAAPGQHGVIRYPEQHGGHGTAVPVNAAESYIKRMYGARTPSQQQGD